MPFLKRAVLALPFVGLAACDEVAVANDPAALSEVRGAKSCVAAVSKETGTKATLNTTEQVIEVNYFIVDLPGGGQWTCVTDENGRAKEIVKRRA